MILALKAQLKSVFANYLAARKVHALYKNEILPQSILSLKSDQSSYTQGDVTFEKVIGTYLRLIRFEDQFVESEARLASLESELEKILGRDFKVGDM